MQEQLNITKLLIGSAFNRVRIFKPLWRESIFAIKESTRFDDFKSFRKYIENNLPQNSPSSRERNVRAILRRFFPDHSLNQISPKVWKAYKDEMILQEVMRYEFLIAEEDIAEFISSHVLPLSPGTPINKESIRQFLIKRRNSEYPEDATRLGTALRDLGFVSRSRGKMVIKEIPVPRTSFLILLQYLFGPTQKTIRLKEILGHNFWQFLGIRSQDIVRAILKEAASKDLIAKYIIADELEQVTTKYSLNEFLEGKMKL